MSSESAIKYLKSSISNLNINDVESSYSNLVHILNEPNDKVKNIFQRCRRAIIPLSICVISSPSITININSIPPTSSIPLHTRPGKVFGCIVEGSHVCVNEFIIHDVYLSSEAKSNSKLIEGLFEDAYAQSEDEDCVCRGGVCPRRYGCVFWVEKKLRDERGYLSGEFISADLLSSDKTCFSFQDNNNIQPREFVNQDKQSAAILLEIIVTEDDFNTSGSVSNIQYYRTIQGSKSQTQHGIMSTLEDIGKNLEKEVLVYSSDVPLGPSLVHSQESTQH